MKPSSIILVFFAGIVSLCINCRFQSTETSILQTKTADTNVSPVPTPTTEDNRNAELNTVGKTKIDVTCKDEELSPIWRILSDDKDIKELIIESELGGDCSDYVSIVKNVDLNNDGINELFVEGNGNFGSVSTAPIWVIGKDGDSFKILLREQGEIYEIKKSRTNFYSDLYFPSRRNVASSFLSTYEFNDGKYRLQKCQVAFFNRSEKPYKIFDCGETEKIEKFESENLNR